MGFGYKVVDVKVEIKIVKEIEINDFDKELCGDCKFLDYWYCQLFDCTLDCKDFFPTRIGKMRADECLNAEVKMYDSEAIKCKCNTWFCECDGFFVKGEKVCKVCALREVVKK